MKVLKELAGIISKSKIQKVNIIGNTGNRSSMLNRFYEALENNRFETDQEASAFFFEGKNSRDKYYTLKHRLWKRMLNTLFFIDINEPKYSDRQKAYYSGWRDFAAAKILSGKTAHYSSTRLLEGIMKQSIKYEYPLLVKETAHELRIFYGSIKGDIKKFEYYDNLYTHYEEIALAESKAEGFYTNLAVKYLKYKDKKTKDDLHKKSTQYYKEIEPFLAKFNTTKLHLSGRLIAILVKMSSGDHYGVRQVCIEAIEFFEQKKSPPLSPINFFLRTQLCACILIQNFEEGKTVAEKLLNAPASFNWIANQRLYFLLALYAKEYQKAYEILQIVQSHELYKRLPEYFVELWRMYTAYTHYFIAIGKIKPQIDTKKFRLNKFLNEVPVFSKDKGGMHIPILIIQILFLVHQGKESAAIDRIESLTWYGAKNIRADENFRTNCFIKMLAQLPKAGFRPKRLQRHAAPYWKKLQTVPIHKADQAFEIEVIPYEELWALVVESLS